MTASASNDIRGPEQRLNRWTSWAGGALLLVFMAIGWVQWVQLGRINSQLIDKGDNIVWSFFQLESEYLHLRDLLRDANRNPDHIKLDVLSERYEIFASRLPLVQPERTQDFMPTQPEHLQTLEKIQQLITAADPYLSENAGKPLRPDALQALLKQMEMLREPIHALSLMSNEMNANLISARNQTVREQNMVSIGLTVFQILLTLSFALLLLRQFRALGSSNRHLQAQQEELRQSNKKLEKKNRLLAEQKVQIEAAKLTLEEKVEQLALTSKYKSEFLSNMSHELRTPLNSLLILSELLAENAEHNLSGRQVEYAKTIQGAGKDLLTLINDILDLSKIESGTVTPDLQEVSFDTICEQVERSFRHVAQSRSLGFGVELAPGLPPSLYTDSQRLQQVMKNLLSNAFKFTQKGRVSLRIAAVESGWSVDHDRLNRAQTVIGFYVTDTGIGLPTTKQKIIFEAFQQADTGTARKYGGTGLGLSISREIAWLLGGELRLLESSPGQGSTFALYLPLAAPEPGQNRRGTPRGVPGSGQRLERGGESADLEAARPDPAAKVAARVSMPQETNPQPPAVADDRAAIKPGDRTLLSINPAADLAGTPSAASLAGKKVLVVDDDVRNIFALTAVLERHKIAVLFAENGRAALEELGKNPDVDIVLMDIMMPEMDGYEAMRQIRQMKQFESLPMIALTAKAMKGDREKCIEAGASDYASKPVDTDQLLSLLRVWLYR